MQPNEFPNFRWVGNFGNRRVGSPLWWALCECSFCGAGICIPDMGWARRDGLALSLECASVHGLGGVAGICHGFIAWNTRGHRCSSLPLQQDPCGWVSLEPGQPCSGCCCSCSAANSRFYTGTGSRWCDWDAALGPSSSSCIFLTSLSL